MRVSGGGGGGGVCVCECVCVCARARASVLACASECVFHGRALACVSHVLSFWVNVFCPPDSIRSDGTNTFSENTHQLSIIRRVFQGHFAAASDLQVEAEPACLWGNKEACHLSHVTGNVFSHMVAFVDD